MTLTVMQTSVKSFQLMFQILSRSRQISKEKRLDRPVGQVIANTYLTNMVLFKKSKQEMLQLVNVDHFLLGAVKLTKHGMGVYRGWLVYCHSRPVVTCWAPTVGRRDMTINTAPSMICHSSHITQTKHQATKSI